MSRFSKLPGISDDGGRRNYVVGFVYLLAVFALIGAMGGGGAEDPDASNAVDATTVAPTTALETTAADTPTATATATTTAASTTTETTAAPTTTSTTAAPTTAEPAPDGESYSYSGSGNEVTESFTSEGGLVVFDFQHSGESNFQVQAIPADGGSEEFLVNDIGDYDGRVALDLPAGDYQLDVTADGEWSADITQPQFNENDLEDLPASAEGEHADWFGPYQFEGTTEVTFEIKDDSQAGVWLATHEGEKVDLLHNEIGPYEGTALINQDGAGIIIVETDSAEWRIEIGGGS